MANPAQVPIGTPLDLIGVAPCAGAARGRQPELRGSPMPYFQRKPVEELVDAVRSIVPIPGLPSRGRAPATRGTAATGPVSPSAAATTGIVEQAAAVLASARPSRAAPGSSARPGCRAPSRQRQGTQVSQTPGAAQRTDRAGSLRSLVAPPGLQTSQRRQSSIFPGRAPPSDAADLVVEPAPVLSPPGPVAPGGAAQIEASRW